MCPVGLRAHVCREILSFLVLITLSFAFVLAFVGLALARPAFCVVVRARPSTCLIVLHALNFLKFHTMNNFIDICDLDCPSPTRSNVF